MAIDSFVCSQAGWQAVKAHSRAGINVGERERQRGTGDSIAMQRTVVLSLNKYTHTQTHTNGGSSVRSLSFHTDLLSRCNVWYAGIQALLNDLISMGLPWHRLVCVYFCVGVGACVWECVFICLQRALPLDKTQDLGQADRHRLRRIQPIRGQETQNTHTDTHTRTHTQLRMK